MSSRHAKVPRLAAPVSDRALPKKGSLEKQDADIGDRRPEAIAQRRLQALADRSPRVAGLRALQAKAARIPMPATAARAQSIVQRTKDAAEWPAELVEAFKYEDIIGWDGTPGASGGVQFIPSNENQYMAAYNDPPRVLYNPATVGQLTPQQRYFMIMHELSHLYYGHPGNDHPDSVLNETQADDTALVNAITYFPEQAPEAIASAAELFDWMIAQGDLGGGSHPLTVDRRQRLEQLFVAIMDNATVRVEIRSNWIPTLQMQEFRAVHGATLLIEDDDVRTFQAQNGSFSYIQGNGVVTLRQYLDWRPRFNERRNLLPGFEYSVAWVNRPVTVQNQVKDQIAGAIPQQ